jgi:hypothetical protein
MFIPDPGSLNWIFPPSRIQDPDPGSRGQKNTGSRSATLLRRMSKILEQLMYRPRHFLKIS